VKGEDTQETDLLELVTRRENKGLLFKEILARGEGLSSGDQLISKEKEAATNC
jgi:hypothetical protein